MRVVEVQSAEIRLGQFIKLAGLLDSGGEAKSLIAAGAVRVNDEPETRRGRRLHRGDVVATADRSAQVG